MTLNEYQERAMTTCMDSSNNFAYMMLNLVGEVGEFSSKVAKAIRKKQVYIGDTTREGGTNDINFAKIFTSDKESMVDIDTNLEKEAGDILWQLSGLCNVMGWNLEDVAQMNLDKLHVRKQAGTIDGSGDGNTAEEGRK